MDTIINPIQIKLLNHATDILPYYATEQCSGMDLLAANIEDIIIRPGESKIIPTGICIALPSMFEAQIRPRSGLAAKNNITVLNSPGTIDEDYRGEIKVILINHGFNEFIVSRGMRIAQMVIARYYKIPAWQKVIDLEETTRNDKGFGSSGI
jgi:dUTP pyrophosphatase